MNFQAVDNRYVCLEASKKNIIISPVSIMFRQLKSRCRKADLSISLTALGEQTGS